MKQHLSDILSSIKECNSLLDNGAIEDAVLLSGEALAKAHHFWASAINNHSESQHEVNIMAIAASIHCYALALMGKTNDAYSTAIGAILQITIDNNRSRNIDNSMLSIYTTAAVSLMRILSENPPCDSEAKEHGTIITRYIASLLYYYYNLIGNEMPDSPYLESAYATLNHLRQFTSIETPSINVLGQWVSPNEPHDIIGDLIGRSRALSLLSDL